MTNLIESVDNIKIQIGIIYYLILKKGIILFPRCINIES